MLQKLLTPIRKEILTSQVWETCGGDLRPEWTAGGRKTEGLSMVSRQFKDDSLSQCPKSCGTSLSMCSCFRSRSLRSFCQTNERSCYLVCQICSVKISAGTWLYTCTLQVAKLRLFLEIIMSKWQSLFITGDTIHRLTEGGIPYYTIFFSYTLFFLWKTVSSWHHHFRSEIKQGTLIWNKGSSLKWGKGFESFAANTCTPIQNWEVITPALSPGNGHKMLQSIEWN